MTDILYVDLKEFNNISFHNLTELIYFSVPNCAPCLEMMPRVQEAASLFTKSIKNLIIVKDEITEFSDARKMVINTNIKIFPTTCLLISGVDPHWIRGARDKSGPYDSSRIVRWLSDCLEASGSATR